MMKTTGLLTLLLSILGPELPLKALASDEFFHAPPETAHCKYTRKNIKYVLNYSTEEGFATGIIFQVSQNDQIQPIETFSWIPVSTSKVWFRKHHYDQDIEFGALKYFTVTRLLTSEGFAPLARGAIKPTSNPLGSESEICCEYLPL